MKVLWPLVATLLLTISGCSKAASDTGTSTTGSQSNPIAANVKEVATPTPIKDITGNAPESVRKAISEHIQSSGLTTHIVSINTTEMPNLYWVSFKEVPPVFISGDGQFLLQGELAKLVKGDVVSISDQLNAQENKRLITSIPEKNLIIFSPANGKPKAVIYAFTDVDCGYCRKLHSEINQINGKGIEVRYIAWPRGQEDLANNQAVWCSEDRKSAMTTAKHGLPVQAPACNDPVLEERHIGNLVGVNGTPALYTADGQYLGGYIPYMELAKQLKIDN